MRPILRPGCHVVRRNQEELQVGLDPQLAVVLPRSGEVEACLGLLARAADEGEYAGSPTLAALRQAGLLVDSGALMPLIPLHESPVPTSPASSGGSVRGSPDPMATATSARPVVRPPRTAIAAIAHTDGDRVGELLSARRACPADLVSFGPEPAGRLVEELSRLLAGAGVPARAATGIAPRHRSASRRVGVLLAVGEPRRAVLDEWMRAGTPHLVLRARESTVMLGPFVVPGRTACLRCVDAHHTDVDPAWPLLVEQYAALSGHERPDGVPEPVDHLVATAALAWAGRDVVSYAEGRRPSTWSTTVRFDPRLSEVQACPWLRHPGCGCAWG